MLKNCFGLMAAMTFAMTVPLQAALVDNLENYWNFDDNLTDQAHALAGSASTVADNGVFAGTNGTGGIAYGSGRFGAGIDQDGAGGAAQNNGYVHVASSADTRHDGESISTSIWVNVAGFDTSWQAILAHGEGTQFRIARRGGDNVASYSGGSGDIPGSAIGPPLDDGRWHHIVAISELAVSTRLWVDGGLVAVGGPAFIDDIGNSDPPAPDLFIGANPQTGAQNREWRGQIDDTAIWNRALTNDEIAEIYTGGQAGRSLGDLIVPEPATGLIALAGLAAFVCRRPRRSA